MTPGFLYNFLCFFLFVFFTALNRKSRIKNVNKENMSCLFLWLIGWFVFYTISSVVHALLLLFLFCNVFFAFNY